MFGLVYWENERVKVYEKEFQHAQQAEEFAKTNGFERFIVIPTQCQRIDFPKEIFDIGEVSVEHLR